MTTQSSLCPLTLYVGLKLLQEITVMDGFSVKLVPEPPYHIQIQVNSEISQAELARLHTRPIR